MRSLERYATRLQATSRSGYRRFIYGAGPKCCRSDNQTSIFVSPGRCRWMDNNQIAWLQSELTSAPQEKAVIVSMHHPIYSADIYHSGSTYMHNTLDQAIQNSGRVPDAVFAGHVHNYQRYTRTLNGRALTYLVCRLLLEKKKKKIKQVQSVQIT